MLAVHCSSRIPVSAARGTEFVIEIIWMTFLLGGALAIAWVVAQPAAEFVVEVRDGVGRATKGKVTDAFLGAVADVCSEFGVTTCVVRGVARGARISLRFPPGFPEPARQRLRNWWAMSGWSAKGGVRRGPRV